MKINLGYLSIVITLLITPLSAIEKRDCTGLKKLSKAFLTCKSGNFKAGVVNTGSKIKKNTIGKIKKKDTTNGETTSNKISKATKEKAAGVKKQVNKMFRSNTKQYPKGTK